MPFPNPALGEPFLLTPGPLTTSEAVKRAMLRDWGSWDDEFRAVTREIRARLLGMLDAPEGYDCVPMQGSGTFSVEAMLGSFVPRDGKVLVLKNGVYGQRISQTLAYLGRNHTVIDKGDYLPPRGGEVQAALQADPAITHVVAVHCETSSGILNPLRDISDAVQAEGRTHHCRRLRYRPCGGICRGFQEPRRRDQHGRGARTDGLAQGFTHF